MWLDKILGEHELAKQILSFALSIISTAIGFFFALYFNNKLEDKKAERIFQNIKKSINAEIEQNCIVIKDSFEPYFQDVIFNKLNVNVTGEHLIDQAFLKFVSSELLIKLQTYIRTCELCNEQKNQLKNFRLSESGESWLPSLEFNFNGNIDKIKKLSADLTTQLK